MNQQSISAWLLLSSIFLAANTSHAETRWKCPEKVMPTKIEINASAVSDWQMSSGEMPLWLTNVGVYDGPVNENAALVPDQQKNQQDTWLFSRPSTASKYIACEYANGLVKLSQPVASRITRCAVKTLKSKKYSGIEAEFMCSEK